MLKLEYEAYPPMALSELKKICDTIRKRWNVIHIALYHRTGEVPITETSVFVAISSIHRRDSLEACHVRYTLRGTSYFDRYRNIELFS